MTMMKQRKRFTLLLILLIMGIEAKDWWENFTPFVTKAPKFSSSGYKEISVGLGEVNGIIGAYGDFDSDYFLDIFIIEKDENDVQNKISVYRWNHKEYQFSRVDSATVNLFNKNITNIILSDVNYDGLLDLLIQGLLIDNNNNNDNDNDNNGGNNFIDLFIGNGMNFTWEKGLPISKEFGDVQMTLLDANFDLKVDLFGQRQFLIQTENGTWISEEMEGEKISAPHSNAFIDINGDCLSDLILISEKDDRKTLEIWIADLHSGFIFDQSFFLPIGAGQISFFDIDGEGRIDIIIPVCYPQPTCDEENSIHIAYNTQKNICDGLFNINEDCLKINDLCSSSSYSLPSLDQSFNSDDYVIVKIETEENFTFNFNYDQFPFTLKIGDYNIDGYGDILISTFNQETKKYQIQMWKNILCNEELCGKEATSKNRRFFTLQNDSKFNDLLNIDNAISASFFDLDEDGSLDILLTLDLSLPPNTNEKGYGIKVIYNYLSNDAFFLKVLVSNGLCPYWCITGDKFPNPKPVAVNYPGAMVKLAYTDINSNRRILLSSQLSQTAYNSLQLPYSFFGLGRTTNYIEYLFLSVSSNSSDSYYKSWSGIIPNSNIAAFPYGKEVADWSIFVSVVPSGITFYVIIACFFSCAILILSIAFLRYKEKKEDRIKTKENAHMFLM